jgi:hypothetical protein
MPNEAVVALAVFVIGVVFYAGMMAARVSSLEEWRIEMKHELDAIHTGIRHIEHFVNRREDKKDS